MNIYEIAKKAGVSIATVSRVINNNPNVRDETREKVEAAIREANYTVNDIARSLAVKATHTIGVMTSDVRDSYYANAIYTIEQEFRNLGYNVILCNTGRELKKKKKYLKVLLEKQVDGIILVGSVFKEPNDNSHIVDTAKKVPIVMLNSYIEGSNIYSIVCDDARASFNIVEYLHKRGHRHIRYIYDVDSFSGLAKIAGFKKGMSHFKLPIDENTLIHVKSGLEGGIEAVAALEAEGSPYTALVASEDLIAAGIIKGLRDIGKRIPQDVSVFGFNNSTIALCTYPELASVDNKVEDMARGAVKTLYAILNNQEVDRKKVVLPELILRDSCDYDIE
ncbi:MAG TPA: LacI family transcriptional regulator [Clostridiales bacterium]|nr:LacI family transcriptional regulator [Clostridiales bacterium]